MESRLPRDKYRMISIQSMETGNLYEKIRDLAGKSHVTIINDGFHKSKEDNSVKFNLVVKVKNDNSLKEYCDSIYALESIRKISLERWIL